jgi:YHS domain-containing protein
MKSTDLRRPQASPAKPQIREVQRRGATSAPTNAPEDKPYTDPVCGMKAAANPDKSAIHEGQTYYFCSAGCVSKFTSDPMRYLSPERKNEPTGPADAIYTCPMDPEIKQVGPGSCPICGMALEPMQATMEEDTTELDDMTRRFWFSLALSLPLLFLSMSELIGIDSAALLGHTVHAWLQGLLATPVVFWLRLAIS